MLRQPVPSKAIRSVGYDREQEVLELEYTNGRIYQYLAVPPALHEWLLRVRSKGVFIARQLNGYDYRDVTPASESTDLLAALGASVRSQDAEGSPDE